VNAVFNGPRWAEVRGGVSRFAGRLFSIFLFLGLALVVLSDGTSSALLGRDPEHPLRAIACFTALEIAVGVNQPSFLRPLEIVVGLGLLCYSPWAGRRRARAGGSPSK
jgi:hypothetical protein